jgi:hypothetical protein
VPDFGDHGADDSESQGGGDTQREAGYQSPRYLLLLAGLLFAGLAFPAAWAGAEVQALPDWLEPRGLNLVELVGEIPEGQLQGMIISYGPGSGIVVYESGTRIQDTVILTTTIYSRLYYRDSAPNDLVTVFGCLGQTPFFDHMGSVVPTSTLRIYDGGAEVTAQIKRMFVSRMDTQKPLADSTAVGRYPEDRYGEGFPDPLPLGPEGLTIPPNSGCRIELPGADVYPLTGVFRLEFPAAVRASVLATQHATFKTAIFLGNWGVFNGLRDQLLARYPDRHGRISLDVPAGADFVLVKFPPTGGDPYADSLIPLPLPRYNAGRPAGGTYRLGRRFVDLSHDLIFSAAFPLEVAWQDADQATQSEYLPLIVSPNQLAPPEYILPAGIPYDNCFVAGNCSPAVLEQIHDAVMNLEIIYLSVTAIESTGQWVHLRFAGPQWPGAALVSVTGTRAEAEPRAASAAAPTPGWKLFLPIIWRQFVLPDPPGGIQAGWFDGLGRMLDFSSGLP